MKKIIIPSAIAILTFNTYAQEPIPKQSDMPLGPVQGCNGIVFPKEKLTTAVKSIFYTKNNTYDGNNEISDSSDKEFSAAIYKTIIQYGFGANIDMRLIVPIVDKSMSMYNTKISSTGDFENSGLGDIQIFMRYQLTSPALGNSFYSAIGMGIELPTGTTDKDFYLNNGTLLSNNQPDGMQNGDGSIDPIIEFGLTKKIAKSRIDLSATYYFNQEGANDFEKGDKFTYNAGYSYRLHSKFMPSIELNGTISEKNNKNGADVNSTGGHELFLTPGFSSSMTKKLKLFAGVGIPVYRDLNTGTLGTDIRVTTKFCYVW
jgi:hypothetical protein